MGHTPTRWSLTSSAGDLWARLVKSSQFWGSMFTMALWFLACSNQAWHRRLIRDQAPCRETGSKFRHRAGAGSDKQSESHYEWHLMSSRSLCMYAFCENVFVCVWAACVNHLCLWSSLPPTCRTQWKQWDTAELVQREAAFSEPFPLPPSSQSMWSVQRDCLRFLHQNQRLTSSNPSPIADVLI